MDIVMPDDSGIEACRTIKADPRLRDIPIIMVTAMCEDHDLDEAFAAGAIDYVTKPIKVVELLARLRSALTLKHELDQRHARQLELMQMTNRLRAMNEELERLSTEDPLTGVANRRMFDEVLGREWGRLARDKAPLAAIMMDIDHFKAYNDHFGHPQGDECLRRVAEALREQVRRPADTLARYGGEEFVALLPRTSREGARAVAESFHAAIDRLRIPHAPAPQYDHVTLSVGVATLIPDPHGDPENLIRSADRALYEAKRQGRNRIVLSRDDGRSVSGRSA
jgi:diguanylate cyclase (GGDEF)-like protein